MLRLDEALDRRAEIAQARADLQAGNGHKPYFETLVVTPAGSLGASPYVDHVGGVNTFNGNYHYEATDITVPGAGPQLTARPRGLALQSQLRLVGVDMRPRATEFNTLVDRWMSGEFQAVVAGWDLFLSFACLVVTVLDALLLLGRLASAFLWTTLAALLVSLALTGWRRIWGSTIL